MALDLLEWGTIAVMVMAVFLWGPEKVPEIAKTLGNARRDLESYTRQFQGITKELTTAAGTGNIDSLMGTLTGLAENPSKLAGNAGKDSPAASQAPASDPASSGDKLLVEMAKKLQISTQGKTREQIQSEIVARASQGQATPVEATQVLGTGDATPAPNSGETVAEDPRGEPGTSGPAAQATSAG